mmetsp:Transcript_19548/g.52111  ORF Transcript_19548/g.52111 Transcript_19548/m.52111 type:complete len:279 (+) Transcript_19548:427-1263(+)
MTLHHIQSVNSTNNLMFLPSRMHGISCKNRKRIPVSGTTSLRFGSMHAHSTSSVRYGRVRRSPCSSTIYRSMKSHVRVLPRPQTPCPRNRQSRPCVKTVRAAGRSQQPRARARSSPTVKRLLEQLQNPISTSLSCCRWPGHVTVAVWRRTLSNRPPERNSSRWRSTSRATSGAPSSRRTRTTFCRSAWRCCRRPIFSLLWMSYWGMVLPRRATALGAVSCNAWWSIVPPNRPLPCLTKFFARLQPCAGTALATSCFNICLSSAPLASSAVWSTHWNLR